MIRRVLFFFLFLGFFVTTGTLSYAGTKHGYVGQGRYDVLLLRGNKTNVYQRRRHGRSFGMLAFKREAPSFDYRLRAHGLKPHHVYTLIYFPDPWPGDNLMCLGQGTTDKRGKLKYSKHVDINSSLPAAFDENYPDGARLWLVPGTDVDCYGRRFTDWNPGAYLYETRLITYTDTDVWFDYTGRWCLVFERVGGEFWASLELEQTGSEVTATVEGYELTGNLVGNTITLTGPGPDGLLLSIVLVFEADGESFTGTVSTTAETLSATGTKGACFDYEDPPGAPDCRLPMLEPGLVTGGQQFNSEYAGVVHSGLDFRFDSPLPTIVAPCDGVVTGIEVHPISEGNLIVDVNIRYNAEWNYFIAFEPYSPIVAIAEQQQAEIAVSIGQVVSRGDVLGRLVVPGDTAFPHIHWGVNLAGTGSVCPRDVLTAAEQVELDAMYASFSLSPVCLTPP